MIHRPVSASIRHFLLAFLSLGAIHQTAAWPGIQSVCHVFLVLGLAPEFRSPFVGALWAAAAGWVLEGSLRMYPHMGGTALANMIVCLLVAWTLIQWPPLSVKPYWARLGAFAVLHLFLVHGAVLLAAGAHIWGSGPIWTLLLLPVWATVAFKLYRPHYRV
jgi:hypothetical protein